MPLRPEETSNDLRAQRGNFLIKPSLLNNCDNGVDDDEYDDGDAGDDVDDDTQLMTYWSRFAPLHHLQSNPLATQGTPAWRRSNFINTHESCIECKN